MPCGSMIICLLQAELASFFPLFVFVDLCRKLPNVFFALLCSLFKAALSPNH